LHHLADFVQKEKLPSLLFAEVKDVRSAIEAKCNPTDDVNLLRDVVDALEHACPEGLSTNVLVSSDVAPVGIGFGPRLIEGREFADLKQVVITNRNGEMRPLLSVLQNVFDASAINSGAHGLNRGVPLGV
jgi:hypothetical protein